ncbi:uncharacterized protein LOC101857475 [Aplysia californica]|uniref:Uncharacterized protein LOC101857475 n=1 Tax=Aplysia californica TaxID=6500 RepID=A0ABM0JJ35_APLCA|nr:uncharacterized protein LOC101857475 [Aplysia californica]
MVEESELAEMYGPSKPPKLAVYPFPPYAKTRREPTVVLDEDGYVVAGNLPGYGELPGLGLHNNAKPSPTSRERQPSKPAKALDGGAVPKPTLEYYKEGLERGIQEFLGQNSALNDISPAAVFPPTVVSFGDKRLSSANDGVKRAESILSSICGGKQRSHKQDCGVKRPCQKQAQLKQKAKKQQQKGQVSTMSREKSVALFGKPEGDAMLDAGQGFVLVLDKSLDVLFVSENVYLHLGHHQVNLLGRSIEDLIHPKDLAALRWHLRDEQFKKGEADRVPSWMLRRMFYLGMNFSFQRPGCRSKESGYTVSVQFVFRRK